MRTDCDQVWHADAETQSFGNGIRVLGLPVRESSRRTFPMSILSKANPGALTERCVSSGEATSGKTSRKACRLARLLKTDEGGPLLEFAFVLPMMMACLTGIFAFGVAIYSAINLTQATGQAAQYLQSVTATTADPCSDAMTTIENAAPTLKSSNITLSLSLNGGSATTGNSCTSLASSFNDAANGSYFTLSASYPCSLLVYGINLGSCRLASKNTYYIYNN
jgi:Flp pilus assembly protein TadG